MIVSMLIASALAAAPWDELASSTGWPWQRITATADNSAWYGTNNGTLYVSFHRGDGWTYLADAPDDIRSVWYDATGGDICVSTGDSKEWCRVGGPGGSWRQAPKPFVRIDGTWTMLSPALPDVPAETVALARIDEATWVAGGEGGVAITRDRGASWAPRNTWLTETEVHDLRVTGARWTALTDHHVWRSVDQGATWSQMNKTGTSYRYTLSRIVDESASQVWAECGESLCLISDAGVTTSKSYCGSPRLRGGGTIVCTAGNGVLEIDPTSLAEVRRLRQDLQLPSITRFNDVDGGVLAFAAGAVASSRDGRQWSFLKEKPGYRDITDLQIHPKLSIRYATTTDGFYVQKQAGEAWQARLSGDDISAMWVDGRGAGAIIVATEPGAVFASSDAGWTFSKVAEPASSVVSPRRVIPVGEAGYAMATARRALMVYDTTWHRTLYSADVGRTVLDVAGGSEGLWVAAELNGLFSVTADGAVATRAWVGCEVALSVAVHPERPGTVAVGCEDGKIRVTTDGGARWAPLDAGVRGSVTALLWPRIAPGSLLVGTTATEAVLVPKAAEG